MVNGNQVTISGTPSADISVTTVYPFTVTTSGGSCADASLSGTITVDPEGAAQLTSGAGTDTQTICEQTAIQDITYLLVDGATGATITGLPPGLNFNVNAGIVTIFGTPTVDVTTPTTYNYTLTTTGGACPGTATGTITINPDGDLTQTSAIGTESQVLCEGASILDITYTFSGGATGATVTGLPAGVTFVVNGNQITISGTPSADISVTTVYPFTVTTSGGSCADASLSGTITVDPEGAAQLTSGAGTDTQTICEQTAIQDITYLLVDGATGATITGLPPGLNFNVNAGIVTIFGTPTVDVTTPTTYNYTLTTTGGACPGTATGTITINPDDELTQTSAIGTESQVLCEGASILDITYTFSGGATGATVTGLPAGVTFVVNGNQITISGTPSADISVTTVYPFTVTTSGGSCADASLSGTITVDPEGAAQLTSGAGTDTQTICEQTAIQDITYLLVDGATGATITGLPPGLNFNVNAGIVTIFGTPTVDVTTPTTYNYTLTTTGGACPGTATGTITINPDGDLTQTSAIGTESQVLCEGASILDITYTFSGGATGATVTGLPAGVTFVVNGNQITISGTPSADISVTTVYPFTVTTSGGSCADASLSGTITVDPEGAAQLTSGAGTDTQTICEQTAIQDITYLLVDGATGATITGLPPGLNFNVNAGIVTIFGTPTVDVTTPTTYNYTLTTTGGACPGTATGTITINPDGDLTQTSAIGTESQVLCEGASILDITYTFSGGATGATVTGLPAGVTFVVNGNQITIGGTPSADISVTTVYPFTVTASGGSCADASLSGTITVDPEGAAQLTSGAGTDTQTICEQTAIQDITYLLVDGATGATITGLQLQGLTSM